MFSRRLKGGGALTYFTAIGFGVAFCSRAPVAGGCRFVPLVDDLRLVVLNEALFITSSFYAGTMSEVRRVLLPESTPQAGRELGFWAARRRAMTRCWRPLI